jgi:hypothetical protein
MRPRRSTVRRKRARLLTSKSLTWRRFVVSSVTTFRSQDLGAGEARDLALLLRSGQLATRRLILSRSAPSARVWARTISNEGVRALIIGMAAVFAFMAIYYRVFGLVADGVLLCNVVLLTALLSMMRASLSLPGIAGHHSDSGHGGGRQRTDLRAYPRGVARGCFAAVRYSSPALRRRSPRSPTPTSRR